MQNGLIFIGRVFPEMKLLILVIIFNPKINYNFIIEVILKNALILDYYKNIDEN